MSVKASTQYAGFSAHTCTSGREIEGRVLVLHLRTCPCFGCVKAPGCPQGVCTVRRAQRAHLYKWEGDSATGPSAALKDLSLSGCVKAPGCPSRCMHSTQGSARTPAQVGGR